MTVFEQDFSAFEQACTAGNKEDILRELVQLAPLQSLSSQTVNLDQFVEGTDNPQFRLAISTLNEEASATLRKEYRLEGLPLPDAISMKAQFDVEKILAQDDFREVVRDALLANRGELIQRMTHSMGNVAETFYDVLSTFGLDRQEIRSQTGIDVKQELKKASGENPPAKQYFYNVCAGGNRESMRSTLLAVAPELLIFDKSSPEIDEALRLVLTTGDESIIDHAFSLAGLYEHPINHDMLVAKGNALKQISDGTLSATPEAAAPLMKAALLNNRGELLKGGFNMATGFKQEFCNFLLDAGITAGNLKEVGGISMTDMANFGNAGKERSRALSA